MCILDPCAGEGVAIVEAVEFDAERSPHICGLVDHCLHADLMDMTISKQSYGLL